MYKRHTKVQSLNSTGIDFPQEQDKKTNILSYNSGQFLTFFREREREREKRKRQKRATLLKSMYDLEATKSSQPYTLHQNPGIK